MNSLTDNVYTSAAGLRYFYGKREKQDGGNDIGAPIIIGGVDTTTGGWYTGGSTLTDAEKEDMTRAVVAWKQVYETVLISNLDILKNNGSAGILKLVASKVKIAEKRLKSRLSSGIYSDGTNALMFNGLGQIISATVAYGGLAVADVKDEFGANSWKAYVSAAQTALTEQSMQLALGKATEDADRPDVALMTQAVYNEVWGLLKDHQRILADDSSFSGAGHDQRKVLMYNGLPHHVDSHMKAGSIYYINSEYTKLIVHSMEDMKAQSFKQLENSNAIKERMLLTGNMFCQSRRANSELSGITVVA